jgi:soluble lytic murein transglycosylase-like protein
MAGDREFFLPQVAREAAALGVPAEVADAVAMVETGYRPDAIGSSGEIGIMQILPSTAMQLGFHGSLTELLEPAINIHLAVEYLGRAWAMSGGDICRALMKYRAGLGEEVMTPLSVQYCTRAISWLRGVGSRLGMNAALPGGVASPSVTADPYVIAIGPALAANAQMMAVAAPAPLHPHPRRTMAQRAAALQARFDSHVRHVGNQSGEDGSDDW